MFDGSFYANSFWAMAAVCAGLYFKNRQEKAKPADVSAVDLVLFKTFQRNWLLVYLLAFFADWLQGPYVYALYVSYGFDSEDIAILFIMGFCASMVVGTFVGALSDKYGRRNMCIAFSVAYFISALTKLSTNFYTLLVGRFLSGVATSLLFSTFEAWMVSEHQNRGFASSLLEETFALATLGNGVVAVSAGLAAGQVADLYGFVAPFILCLVPLAITGVMVASTWSENYGDQKVEIVAMFSNAWATIRADSRILYLGAAQSAFEGAMYTFVFLWTPALATTDTKDSLPYGTIFAVFMVCSMIGSSVFSMLMSRVKLETLPHYIFIPAALCMFSAAFFIESKSTVYVAFLIFEVTVGMFYPTFGTLRSIYVPEASRGAVMNFFRIPLNAFVVVVLIKIKFLPITTVFYICAAAHAFAWVMFWRFKAAVAAQPAPLPSTNVAAAAH